jgi:hypothetical protein
MKDKPQKDNSRLVMALVLIGIGFIWLLQKAGAAFHVSIPVFTNQIFSFSPFLLNLWKIVTSWQVILIIVGIILLAGRRQTGIVLIILGSIFLAPKIVTLPHLAFPFLIPLLLVIVGVVLMVNHWKKQIK